MPVQPDGSFARVWKFVDQFIAGEDALRSDFDTALDDITVGVNAALDRKAVFASWDASGGTFPSGADQYQQYVASAAGTVDGIPFNINDVIIALVDNASTSTFSGNWRVVKRAQGSFTYSTKAAATLVLGGFSEGDMVDVTDDESREGASVRYTVQGGALVFKNFLGEVPKYAAVTDLLSTTEGPRGVGAYWNAGGGLLVETDSGGDFDLDPADGWPAHLIVQQHVIGFCPSMFGAAGLNETVDNAAFKKAIARAKQHRTGVFGQAGATYLISESLWFGNDAASAGISAIIGNKATIEVRVQNEPVFDLVGIENGRKVLVEGWRFEGFDDTYKPRCIMLAGRPKQASGVKSSGNMIIHNNTAYAYCLSAVLEVIQSESNLIAENHFFNYNTSGHCIAHVKHDYFSNTVCLDYDGASGDLTGNVTGTSGFGLVFRPANDLGGNTGRVWVHVISGTFSNNDSLSFSGGGSATVNMPDGVTVMGIASPNTTLGIEEASTSTLQTVVGNFLSAEEATNDDSLWFISDWNDITGTQGNNYNQVNNTALYGQIHFQQDRTRNAGASQGCTGLQFSDGYHHSSHRASVTFCDPVTRGGTFEFRITGLKSAGTPSVIEARVQSLAPSSGTAVNCQGCEIDTDFLIDLSNVNWQRNGRIRNHDPANGAIVSNGFFEGEINISSHVDMSGFAPSPDRATILTTDYGVLSTRVRASATVDTGVLTLGGKMTLVSPESGTADTITDIALPSGVVANGDTFFIRSAAGANTLTVDVGVGNIRSQSGLDFILSNVAWIALFYDASVDQFFVIQNAQKTVDSAGFSNIGGTANKSGAISTYTAPAISATPTQAEVQAIADALELWTQRGKAEFDGAKSAGILQN